MNRMKYIKYKHGPSGTLTQIVIFSELDTHRDMASKLSLKEDDVISAGFFTCSPESVQCYGDSYSLGVDSKKEDSEEIMRFLKGSGW